MDSKVAKFSHKVAKLATVVPSSPIGVHGSLHFLFFASQDNWGNKFDDLYERYEREGKGRKTIKAQKLWYAIVESQIETGTPYMLYKDACNGKSNQQNLGTIKCRSVFGGTLQGFPGL